MELSKDTRLMELAASPATTSYGQLLDEQKDLFQNQIEKLQQIVATQCKLTGVNPLSQEMAAGALSIKIGKKPRDLLNPKAVKYMQLVFSMKDAISKRETPEISAQFGVTVTQVRDFFAGQRTRVRKFVRLSREKSNTTASNLMHDRITLASNSDIPAEPILLETVAPIPLDTVAPIPLNTVAPGTLDTMSPIPLDTVAPPSTDEGPSCSKRHEELSGLADSDMHFVKNIFSSMRKEESFSGQIKLMRWILRITSPSALNWFLIEGGLMILATWLSEAAKEEQTSYLLVILKLLDYLPLSKALPGHMSAILQSVNKLRFYRTSDISHRARPLLSKWSKMLGKSLSLKKSNSLKSASDLQDEMLLKQSISEVMGNGSWDLKKENPEDALRLICDNPDSPRKLDTVQPLKMLTASADDSNKRRGVFPPQTRERRKVQLVEHPGQKSAVRSLQVGRSASATQSRPLSADDIQKAKMRAQFMLNKHGKTITSPDEKIKPESEKLKFESENKLAILNGPHASLATSVSKSNVQTEVEEQRRGPHACLATSVPKSNVQTELEEQRRVDGSSSALSNPHEISSLNLEPPWKKYKRIPIPWQIPPEMKIDEAWSVGDGAHSKEVEVQKNRIIREREVVYRTIQEVPSDPREPWDREMDCDDSLTLEIPIEQLPDVEEPVEASSSNPDHSNGTVAPGASASSESIPEPDFELLAELLKNPELVFALTSGQAGNLSSDETVKLLDRIKANGVTSLSNLAGNDNSKVEVSLPSPTPSSDPVLNGAKPDFSRNPFSRQHAGINNVYQVPSQIPATTIMAAQPPTSVQHYPHKVLQNPIQLPEQWQNQQMHHQSRSNYSHTHLNSEMVLNGAPTSALPPSRSVTPPNHPKPQPSLYLQEPLVSDPSRSRHGFKSNNHPYLNSRSGNYHHGYAGGAAPPCVADRSEYESWSPENSPSRRRDYLTGQYDNGPSVNSRNGYRHGKANQQNLVQPSIYQDNRNKRWQDRRR